MSFARKSVLSSDFREIQLVSDKNFQTVEKKSAKNERLFIEKNMTYTFNIRSKKVRDNIISTLKENFKNDVHINDLERHFRDFDSNILDTFSEFNVYITMYNTRINFVTSRMEHSGIEYTIQSWDAKPAEQFKKRKTFFGLF